MESNQQESKIDVKQSYSSCICCKQSQQTQSSSIFQDGQIKYDSDDELDEKTNTFFKIKVEIKKKHHVKVYGSMRICYFFLYLAISGLLLFGLNKFMNNNCQSDYLKYSCNSKRESKICQKISICLNTHKNTYFSPEQNLILAISIILFGAFIYNLAKLPYLRIDHQKRK